MPAPVSPIIAIPSRVFVSMLSMTKDVSPSYQFGRFLLTDTFNQFFILPAQLDLAAEAALPERA